MWNKRWCVSSQSLSGRTSILGLSWQMQTLQASIFTTHTHLKFPIWTVLTSSWELKETAEDPKNAGCFSAQPDKSVVGDEHCWDPPLQEGPCSGSADILRAFEAGTTQAKWFLALVLFS